MVMAKILRLFGVLAAVWSLSGCSQLGRTKADGNILFLSNRGGNYDLYVMNPDGSGQRKLVSPSVVIRSPNDNNGFLPSPNGKEIAYLSDKDGAFGIYVVNIDSSTEFNAAKGRGNVSSFAWSPDGSHIAFVSDLDATLIDANRGLWTSNIYIMDADGSHVQRLTLDNSSSEYGRLSWSPDGRELALDMASAGPDGGPLVSVISVMTLSDTKLKDLTSPGGQAQSVLAWSPDGKQILYSVGTKQLYVMRADGSHQFPLFNKDLGFITDAAWSPDGRQIVFSALLGGNPYLYVVKPDGTNLITMSRDASSYDTSPSWSPDGKSIIFASKRDSGKYHLYTMNADGSDQRRLTGGPGEEAAPIWLWAP
jgi:Tol biopolymer transport system component